MNAARFAFLDNRAQVFYRDWAGNARQIVALLRAEAGRSPYDRILTDLVGELVTRSDVFRTMWAAHDVRAHRAGSKNLHHPVVGDLDLTFQAMDLASEPGVQLLAFSAAPGSPSHDSLHLLTAWAATAQLHTPQIDVPTAVEPTSQERQVHQARRVGSATVRSAGRPRAARSARRPVVRDLFAMDSQARRR